MLNIAVVEDDITRQSVDMIVNAANESLLGGGGVDGAIHRAAGPGLLAECRKLGGCPTGDARLTRGHALPATWIAHAVGPVWHGGGRGEDALLAGCYRAAMTLARSVRARSIAFPAISTGVFRFPAERAARIAIDTVRAAGSEPRMPGQVVFVCFSAPDAEIYMRLLEGNGQGGS